MSNKKLEEFYDMRHVNIASGLPSDGKTYIIRRLQSKDKDFMTQMKHLSKTDYQHQLKQLAGTGKKKTRQLIDYSSYARVFVNNANHPTTFHAMHPHILRDMEPIDRRYKSKMHEYYANGNIYIIDYDRTFTKIGVTDRKAVSAQTKAQKRGR